MDLIIKHIHSIRMKVTNKVSFAIVFLFLFFASAGVAKAAGYTAILNYLGTIPMATGTCSPTGGCTMCLYTGYDSIVTNSIEQSLDSYLNQQHSNIESYIQSTTKTLTKDLIDDLKGMEKSMAKAWAQNWSDVIVAALKSMQDQMSLNNLNGAATDNMLSDADNTVQVTQDMAKLEKQSAEQNEPSIHANIAAVAAGGYGRANAFARAMQKAVPNEIMKIGLGTKGDDNIVSSINYQKYRYDLYINLFCDPSGAGGKLASVCKATDSTYYNADVQPNKFILSRLTIPISPESDTAGNLFKTLIAIRLNLFGDISHNVVTKDAFDSVEGKNNFINWRSYLARYAAVMSVHNLIEGWRMPGSGQGSWIKDLLEISSTDINGEWYAYRDNPSYKEIMYAMTNDRFNSGHYATDLISTAPDIKMEKLVLTTLQLIRLRDYYELLERTALVLAVQNSLMVDGARSQLPVSKTSTEGNGGQP